MRKAAKAKPARKAAVKAARESAKRGPRVGQQLRLPGTPGPKNAAVLETLAFDLKKAKAQQRAAKECADICTEALLSEIKKSGLRPDSQGVYSFTLDGVTFLVPAPKSTVKLKFDKERKDENHKDSDGDSDDSEDD